MTFYPYTKKGGCGKSFSHAEGGGGGGDTTSFEVVNRGRYRILERRGSG